MIRTFAQATVEELAEHAYIPVVNGLTDETPPVPGARRRDDDPRAARRPRGVRVAWLGDGNNVCASLVGDLRRSSGWVRRRDARHGVTSSQNAPRADALRDPREAARGANVVVTDAWTSMGQEDEASSGGATSTGTRSTPELLALADPDAIVLHCLPAHLGEEITADVLYGPQCAAWDEAENRLHTEKALLALVVK